MNQEEKTKAIRHLNDSFRLSGVGGRFVMTPGVLELKTPDIQGLVQTVHQFDIWPEAGDVYGEHDFGALEFKGEKYFWKIDYYDKAMEYGSEDPSDPKQTTRVLTIMRTDEY